MFLVKIHVLVFAESNDYRAEKRGLATVHTSVSWGMEILAFLLCFLERGWCQIFIILLLLFESAVYQRSIQAFLRIDFKEWEAKHFLLIKTFIQKENTSKPKLNN